MFDMKPSKTAAALCSAALALLVLSFSIAVPILFRPFYYAHIKVLDLPARTGWSEDVIREAYDQVLDYCVSGRPFGTGQLLWSEDGRSHFADVRGLFLLDFAVLGCAGLLCLLLLFLHRSGKLSFYRFLGRGPGFWAGATAAGLVTTVGILASLDFQRAFTVFHSLFFPGKDNWIFDPATDQIILIMPEVFFRNCAILIGVVLLVCCAALILTDLLRRRAAGTGAP